MPRLGDPVRRTAERKWPQPLARRRRAREPRTALVSDFLSGAASEAAVGERASGNQDALIQLNGRPSELSYSNKSRSGVRAVQ